jgi:hypothetical protein
VKKGFFQLKMGELYDEVGPMTEDQWDYLLSMKNDKDNDKTKIETEPGSEGQNPQWPGDALKKPGKEKDEDGGETMIPVVR